MTAAVTPVARVRVPARSWRTEARAARVVVWRDLVRLRNDRARIWTALVQPLLFLFVLAPGLDSLARPGTDGVALRTVMFPGVICMTVCFSAMISAAGLVMDRELGFPRELEVAPVGRVSIIAGKCLAGTVIATGQGALVLVLAGLVGVPYDAARQALAPGVTRWGWRLPVALELVLVVGLGAAMLGRAAARFSRLN